MITRISAFHLHKPIRTTFTHMSSFLVPLMKNRNNIGLKDGFTHSEKISSYVQKIRVCGQSTLYRVVEHGSDFEELQIQFKWTAV